MVGHPNEGKNASLEQLMVTDVAKLAMELNMGNHHDNMARVNKQTMPFVHSSKNMQPAVQGKTRGNKPYVHIQSNNLSLSTPKPRRNR
jgi:hypothetical protein